MTSQNEERALDALVAITLRGGATTEVTQADIDRHIKRPHLNDEETRAYDAWRQTCVDRVLGKVGAPSPVAVEEDAFAAMNRDNETDSHDKQSNDEIKRLREKLLEEEDNEE